MCHICVKLILRIENLDKDFYIHHVDRVIKSCHDISFSLEKGQFIGIVGPSGARKSTILKCINRTYLPLKGSIIYKSAAFGRSIWRRLPSGRCRT